jgi:hypothetical protein
MRGDANVRISLGTAGTSGANNSSNWIYGNGTNLRFNNAGGYYSWETLGIERLRIDASGNITQTGANSADFLIKAPTDNASLTLQAGSSDTGAEGAFVNFLQNTTYKWQIGMNIDNSFRWYNYATSSEAMQISPAGNLGIGVVPTAPLHVQVGGSGEIARFRDNAANAVVDVSIVNDSQTWALRVDGASSDSFHIRNSQNSTNPLTIDTSGRVGIGCTPGYTFEVRTNDTSVTPQQVIRQIGSGDAAIGFQIPSAANWYAGVDNSASDSFVIGRGLAVGTDVAMTLGASAATFSGNITATAANINGQLNVTGTTNSNNIYAQQLSTQFDTSSFMRFHPTSVTDSGGFTNIFFGTSTLNNYGVAVGGKRAGTEGEPTFEIRMLNDSTVGTQVLNIANSGDLTGTANTTGLAANFENTNTSGYGMRVTTYSNGAEYGLAVDSYGGGYSRDFTVGVDGNVNVLTGNLVIGTAGKGIDFSATAGSGTSELLADYEEGTWTPTVTTSNGTISTSAQQGTYVKVGDVVHYWIRVVATCTSTAVLYNVDGLPFSTAAYHGFYAGPTIANSYGVSLGTNATVLGGYYLNGTNSIRLHSYGNNTPQLSPSVTANAAFELRFEGSYRLTA